ALSSSFASNLDAGNYPSLFKLDRHLAGARATLGPRAADAAWAEGLSLPPPQATAEALALLDTPEQGKPEPAPVQASPLTPREREVAALVERGLSNRAIARELYF